MKIGESKVYPRTGHAVPQGSRGPLYPWERHDSHCIGGWLGSRTSLDRCRKSHAHWNWIPRLSGHL